MITIYTVHSILILRLYGIYGSKKLVYILCALLGVSLAVEIYVIVKFAPKFLEVDLGPSIGHVCVTAQTRNMAFIW